MHSVKNKLVLRMVFFSLMVIAALPISARMTQAAAQPGQLVFTSDQSGNKEIYAINADGSGLRNLTNNPADDDGAAWSPDGSRIAFVSNRAGQPQIYVMNADGSNIRRLTDIPDVADSPVWSPDSARIAYVTRRSDHGAAFFESQIYIMQANGANPRPLINASVIVSNGSGPARQETITSQDAPAWSPDGTSIAFVNRYSKDGQVTVRPDLGPLWLDSPSGYFVADIDGSAVTRIGAASIYDGGPVWSASGQQLTFVGSPDNGNTWNLTLVNRTGGLSRTLDLGTMPLHPVSSPDGSRLLLGLSAIEIVNADGTNFRTLLADTGLNLSSRWDDVLAGGVLDHRVAWSTDGQQVVVTVNAQGKSTLYVLALDGSSKLNLTPNSANNINPAWRPVF